MYNWYYGTSWNDQKVQPELKVGMQLISKSGGFEYKIEDTKLVLDLLCNEYVTLYKINKSWHTEEDIYKYYYLVSK